MLPHYPSLSCTSKIVERVVTSLPCYYTLYSKIGVARFELATSRSRTVYSTMLSHTPIAYPYNLRNYTRNGE